MLSGVSDHVLYKKVCIKGVRYLYAYKAEKKAGAEAAAYLARREKQKNFSSEHYRKKSWLLELECKRYKSDECLNQTNVQGDFSLICAEFINFINFISTILTCRMLRKARDTKLLDEMSYGELMDDLNSAWRKVDGAFPARSDDDFWVHTLANVFESLEALGLSIPIPKPEPKKRGRKPKPTDQAELIPKRPRGRPRKNPISSAGSL